jgi:hypothetical protein
MSYSPSVQNTSFTVAPHFFAMSLKASARFGASLDLADSLVGEARKQDVGCHGFSSCYVRISALALKFD